MTDSLHAGSGEKIFESAILVGTGFERTTDRRMIHQHDDRLELLLIDTGEGVLQTGMGGYAVNENSLIVCNQGTLHGLEQAGRKYVDSYSMAVRNIFLSGLPENCMISGQVSPVLTLEEEDAQALRYLFKLLHTRFSVTREEDSFCRSLKTTILALVWQQLSTPGSSQILEEEDGKKRMAREIQAYLEAHYLEPVTLEGIGTALNISSSRISHVFREVTGISPILWCLQRRLGDAQSLLSETELPIGEIQERTGFGSINHFCQMFKKQVGITPTEYRKKMTSVAKSHAGEEKQQ